MEVIISFAILIAFLGTIYPMRDLPQGNLQIFQGMAGAERLSQNFTVKPIVEFNNRNIVKQAHDFSCGSAALATLLNYYLGESLSEQQVIQGMMQYGDAEKIQERRAFSLLDMKRFVEVLGYNAAGYKAEFSDLRALKKPAIVPVEFYGYKHFVVYRGVYGDHAFVADPYMGNMSFTIDKFSEMWNPAIVFVVSDGELQTNNLKLKEEDLRIISYDMKESFFLKTLPSDYVKIRQQFKESTGGVGIYTIK